MAPPVHGVVVLIAGLDITDVLAIEYSRIEIAASFVYNENPAALVRIYVKLIGVKIKKITSTAFYMPGVLLIFIVTWLPLQQIPDKYEFANPVCQQFFSDGQGQVAAGIIDPAPMVAICEIDTAVSVFCIKLFVKLDPNTCNGNAFFGLSGCWTVSTHHYISHSFSSVYLNFYVAR